MEVRAVDRGDVQMPVLGTGVGALVTIGVVHLFGMDSLRAHAGVVLSPAFALERMRTVT